MARENFQNGFWYQIFSIKIEFLKIMSKNGNKSKKIFGKINFEAV